MDNTNRPLRMVMVGAGDIAKKAYLPVLRTLPETELAGVYSRTQASVDTVCRDWQLAFGTTDLDALIALKPQVAFVLTKTTVHFEQVKQLLLAGIDVYVEKPATADSRETRELAELAAKEKRLFMVGFNRRYALLYKQAKDLFAGRRIQMIVAEKHRPTAFHVSLYNNYVDDTIHQIDLLRYFCPEMTPLFTTFQQERGRVFGAVSVMGLPEGGQAILQTSLQAGAWQERLSIHGDKLTVEVDAFRQLRVKYPDHEEIYGNDRPGKWLSELRERGFYGEVEHFLACVRERKQPNPDGFEAARTQELVEALTRQAGQETEFLPYAEGAI